MPTLSLSNDALADYGNLPTQIQHKVRELLTKFTAHTHAGIHLEKIRGAKDARVRTVRVDQKYRGVVMAPDAGDTFVLHRILDHDAADIWVAHNRFEINPATGALEVQDLAALGAVRDGLAGTTPAPRPLLDSVRDRDLVELGIPEEVLPLVAAITDTTELAALCAVLPQGQADALELLEAGFSVEEVWADLVAETDPGPVDTGDVVAALNRPTSRARFYVAEGMEEVLDVLNQPFAAWRVFLHPNQRRFAYRETYNGPVRITGGPGTGKTVVAVHRARALADRAAGRSEKILFTTFTRNLADAIEADLVALAGPDVLKAVDVINIDRLALRMVRAAEPISPRIATDAECDRRFEQLVDETGSAYSPSFLSQEWRQVVLGQGISSRDAYLAAARPGRGVPLNRRQRIEVWQAIEAFTNRLVTDGKRTYLQLSDAAAATLDGRAVKPYRHVIVDEAQDLHPSQWRLLRAIVPETTNDLFIVGDAHQRIYDHAVTLSRVGINIRGRSHRLRLNYRTTREILRWSLGLLRGEPFDDLDGATDSLDGYRSHLYGPEPTLCDFVGRPDELRALAEQVTEWIASGVEPATIGIAARTGSLVASAAESLAAHGIPTATLAGSDAKDRTSVAIGTMHRLKGLEFSCVAVIDVDAAHVPLPVAVTPASEDRIEHDRTLRRECSLLFVACTRARDELWIGWAGKASPFLEPMIQNQESGKD
ncbi:MAG TPA: UvrD-helicase domain-containing protein [Acidimicrobiales bacterium]|nr:UvrD-helicase domain-containing protein [Acidimicrobiales bacterium]